MNVEGFLITMFILQFISFGITANKHGQPKEGKENVWIYLFGMGIFWGIAWVFGLL